MRQHAPAAQEGIAQRVIGGHGLQQEDQRQGDQVNAARQGQKAAQQAQHALPGTLEPQQQRQEDQAVQEQDQQIPQVQAHPGEVAAEQVEAIEVVRQEVEIRALEFAVGQTLQVDHQRGVGESAHQQRDQQAQHLILQEFAHLAFTQGVIDAGAGDHEDHRHHPVRQEGDPDIHNGVMGRVCDVPVFMGEETEAVKDEYGQDSQHAQPIQVVPSWGSACLDSHFELLIF